MPESSVAAISAADCQIGQTLESSALDAFYAIREEDITPLEVWEESDDDGTYLLESQQQQQEPSPRVTPKSEVPAIRVYFNDDELKAAVSNISKRLFADGLYTFDSGEGGDTVSMRLLTAGWKWQADYKRKVFCQAPVVEKKKKAFEYREIFPRLFLRSNSRGFDGRTPAGLLETATWREAEQMCERKNVKGVYLSEHEGDYFLGKLSFYLQNRCRPLLKAEGKVLLWHFARRVHELIPPDVLRFALLLRGPNGADALDATIIWQNLAEVESVYRNAPALLPIWLSWTRNKIIGEKPGGRRLQADRWARIDTKKIQGRGIIETMKNLFSSPYEPFAASAPEDAPKSVAGKRQVNALGLEIEDPRDERLQPRAWRFLCHKSYVWGRTVSDHCGNNRGEHKKALGIVRWFNIISSLTVEPKHSVYRFLLDQADGSRWMLPFRYLSAEEFAADVDFISAFVKMANEVKRADLKSYETDFRRSLDWWMSEKPVLNSCQRRAGWKWIMKAQQDWHERLDRRKFDARRQTAWKSNIRFYQDKDRVAFALSDSLALYLEGRFMHHCVGDYAPDCARGDSRIFHLAKLNNAGKVFSASEIPGDSENLMDFIKSGLFDEHSTLELFIFNDNWHIRQIEGFCGAGVEAATKSFAGKILEEYKGDIPF